MALKTESFNLNRCRVCLSEMEELSSLYERVEEVENAEKLLQFTEILAICCNVQVSEEDMKPQNICLNCMEAAKISYKFRTTCEKSELILNNELSNILSECKEDVLIEEEKIFFHKNQDAMEKIKNEDFLINASDTENIIKNEKFEEVYVDEAFLNESDIEQRSPEDNYNFQEEFKMSDRRKSDIWLYFEDRKGEKIAECNLCNTRLSYKTTISNLRRHIRCVHNKLHKKKCKEGSGNPLASSSSTSSNPYELCDVNESSSFCSPLPLQNNTDLEFENLNDEKEDNFAQDLLIDQQNLQKNLNVVSKLGKIKKKIKRYCSVANCKGTTLEGFSLFHFPSDKELLKQWINILKIEKTVTPGMRVCNHHFVTEDFHLSDLPTLRKRLKRGAIPSKNLP